MKQEHDAIEHLLAENDKWNEETAKLRFGLINLLKLLTH